MYVIYRGKKINFLRRDLEQEFLTREWEYLLDVREQPGDLEAHAFLQNFKKKVG